MAACAIKDKYYFVQSSYYRKCTCICCPGKTWQQLHFRPWEVV